MLHLISNYEIEIKKVVSTTLCVRIKNDEIIHFIYLIFINNLYLIDKEVKVRNGC